MGGDPLGGGGETRVEIAVAQPGLARDQREEPLGVGLSVDEPQVVTEVALELVEPAEDAVMGKEAPLLLEGMGIGERQPTGRGETDVRKERG